MSTVSLWAAKKSAPSMGTAALATTNSHLYSLPWMLKSMLMHPSILRDWPSAVEMTGSMYGWRRNVFVGLGTKLRHAPVSMRKAYPDI